MSAQLFHDVELGSIVPSAFFTPPPKVDSQVVILRRRTESLVAPDRQKAFFRLVKAGFSAKRKKLRSSLAGGLQLSKPDVEHLLGHAGISPDARAEDVSLAEWKQLLEALDS